jgi:hypothetical protein
MGSYVITYTNPDGTVQRGTFDFLDSAQTIAGMAPDGDFVGQLVWPL